MTDLGSFSATIPCPYFSRLCYIGEWTGEEEKRELSLPDGKEEMAKHSSCVERESEGSDDILRAGCFLSGPYQQYIAPVPVFQPLCWKIYCERVSPSNGILNTRKEQQVMVIASQTLLVSRNVRTFNEDDSPNLDRA